VAVLKNYESVYLSRELATAPVASGCSRFAMLTMTTGGAPPRAWREARHQPDAASPGGSGKRFRPLCDLVIMRRLTADWPTVASSGAAAIHVLAWPYTAVVLAAAAIYRLLAEQARRKTLVDLVSHAPAGTIVVMEKGPGGPAMWVRVGDGPPYPPRAEVWRGR
jgi:hypothetical protein